MSQGICQNHRARCPGGRFMSAHVQPVCGEQGRYYDLINLEIPVGHNQYSILDNSTGIELEDVIQFLLDLW